MKKVPEFACIRSHFFTTEEVRQHARWLCPECQAPLRPVTSMDRRIWSVRHDPDIIAARRRVPVITAVPDDVVPEPDITIPPYGGS